MIDFAIACLRLNLMALDLGGKPHAIEVALCEDRRSAMIYAEANGHTIAVSFKLDEPMAEEAFDANTYVEALQA